MAPVSPSVSDLFVHTAGRSSPSSGSEAPQDFRRFYECSRTRFEQLVAGVSLITSKRGQNSPASIVSFTRLVRLVARLEHSANGLLFVKSVVQVICSALAALPGKNDLNIHVSLKVRPSSPHICPVRLLLGNVACGRHRWKGRSSC